MEAIETVQHSDDPVVERVGHDLVAEGVATVAQIRAIKLIWTVHRVRRAMDAEFAKLLKPFGLTQSAHRIMRDLRSMEDNRMPMSELGKQLGITTAAVAIQINWLEKRGWVVRVPHPTDRRITYAQLTKEGEVWADRVHPEMHRLSEELCKNLSVEEQSLLIELLGRQTVQIEGRSAGRAAAASAS